MDPFDRNPDVLWGVAEEVAPGIRRVTAENPSIYTFTGTRSYLVGRGDVALIDPGPDDPAHIDAILAALGPAERISHILVTHSHLDHSGGAPALASATGAELLAFGPHGSGMSPTMQGLVETGASLGGGEGSDRNFKPDRRLADGEVIDGKGWRLIALHTPGHLSNHLSFALDGTGIVFTGDIVMGVSTTLVSPPEGDMAAFMASLDRLAKRDDRLYLPGHGHPVRDPAAMLAWQIDHRKQRFMQILDALADRPLDAEALAARIYKDLDPALLPAAARNVFASLIGLVDQGAARVDGAIAVDAVFARS